MVPIDLYDNKNLSFMKISNIIGNVSKRSVAKQYHKLKSINSYT